MTERFNRLINVILDNEGGFVNDPSDPGGATKMGVSLRFLKSVGNIRFDLDHDGDIDIDDIRKMDRDTAKSIYAEFFYIPLKLDQLKNEKLALQVFDHAVNAGSISAIKILQRICGAKDDGIIGPKTISSANTFTEDISGIYHNERLRFYTDLAVKHQKLAKFLAGWTRRVDHTYEMPCQ